jgi:hypothetical protein
MASNQEPRRPGDEPEERHAQPTDEATETPEVPATGGVPGAQRGDPDVVAPSPASPMAGL